MNAMAGLPIDGAQLAAFFDATFRYADQDTYLSLRAFYDRGAGDKSESFFIYGKQIGDDLAAHGEDIAKLAARCTRVARPVVFCPPLATFAGPDKATEEDLRNGLVLSVECDKVPADARMKLESLIGPATVVVASGGEWMDPDTGEIQDKLHLHWRLSEPTTTPDEHRQLKLARAYAARLVGGDASNKPIVHPIRWPGSWHRKGTPRLAHIVALTDAELDLADALERLGEAAAAVPASTTGQSATETAPTGEGEERDTAALVCAVLSGDEYHAPLVALAMRFLRGGMADGQAVLVLRGVLLAIPEAARDMKDGAAQPGRWQSRYDDIPRAVSTARAKLGAANAAPAPEPESVAGLVNPADLQDIEPPAREWIVDGWLPVGTVTSLYGGAGFGKTLLVQQLQTATARGAAFLGLPTVQCRSLAFYCEDDGDELHRRQRSICRLYGTQMAALGAMRWQGRAGMANVLATVEAGLLQPSAFYEFIRRGMRETQARLLILDNIAQLFGGNENVRPEVTQFVNSLTAIAIEFGAAVLLLGHPGKATDSAYSGSTAWDAAVRSRWLLDRPKADIGDDDAAAADLSDVRVLRKAKANYAGTGDEIALRWVKGAFQVEGAASVQQVVDLAERTAAMNADEQVFLDALDALAEQGRHTSASNKANNYAPRLMAGKPAAAGRSRKRLADAMERLFTAGMIEVARFGRDKFRRPVDGIVRKSVQHASDGTDEACCMDAADTETEVLHGAAECSTVPDECSTVACNPLISLLHDDAARMQQGAAEIVIGAKSRG